MMRAAAAFCAMVLSAGAGLSGPAKAEPLEGRRTSAEIIAASKPGDWRALGQDYLLYIDLEPRGQEQRRVVVALSAHFAPGHVAQVKTLARQGFYDGLSFYRVIDGFVAQGGDPFEEREIGEAARAMAPEFDQPLTRSMGFSASADEDGYAATVGFADSLPAGADKAGKRAWLLHCAGAFAFGRNDAPDTASTEFYITLQPHRYLDRNLSVAGRVVWGMEHLQALRRVEPPQSRDDDLGETILAMRISSDLDEGDRLDLEILASGTSTFADYVEARRNRSEGFFVHRPDHIDICQLPVPVRIAPEPAQ